MRPSSRRFAVEQRTDFFTNANMSTTDILFNSPALHSLKRNQLVQLCKRHNIKANGKNIELITRLKQHAQTLPADAPLNVAVRSEEQSSHSGMDIDEEDDEDSEVENIHRTQRPSEMWEVVMEDIPEEAGESQGSLSSLKSMKSIQATGEFGSVKSASVTSSIKAIATSLGLKRTNNTDPIASENSNKGPTRKALSDLLTNRSLNDNLTARDSLTAHAIPYSSLPPATPNSLPKTDPFNFDAADTTISSIDRPIPGLPGFEGVEATDAQASTIRLVTIPALPLIPSPPKLRPFETAFDLVPPTPGGSFSENVSRWPLSPQPSQGSDHIDHIYPTISSVMPKDNDAEDIEMPGGLSPSKGYRNLAALANKSVPPLNETNLLSPGRHEPFVFGSPNPRYSISNKDFTNAANSVLAEFNTRLGLNGQDAIGMDILKSRTLGQGNNGGNSTSSGVSADKDSNKTSQWRFEKAHEEEFKKMPSIKDHYAAKRGLQQNTGVRNKKRKSSALGVGRPGVPANRRRSSTRVISAGTRKRMVPGAFSDDEEEEEAMDEDERDRRLSKKPRLSELPQDGDEHMDEAAMKHVAIASGSGRANEDDEDEAERKDREAIKRRLEYNKAKRRSTMGRVSVGGGRAPLIPNQKNKGASSRFGFLASAKNLVKSVWNRGAGAPYSSTIPVPKVVIVDKKQDKASTKSKSTASSSAKEKAAKPPSLQGLKPPSISKPASRSASGESSRPLKPSSAASVISSTGRSRSPLPTFSVPSGSVKSTATSTIPASVRSKAGSSVGATGRTKTTSSAVSSMGTRRSTATNSNAGISSMGTKRSLASTRNESTSKSVRDASARKRSSSTLLAPTASSLAKMTGRPSATGRDRTASSGSRLPSIQEPKAKAASSSKQDEKRSSEAPIVPLSPKTKSKSIFSQPLIFEDNTNKVSRTDEDSNKILINPITGLPSSSQASHAKEGGEMDVSLADVTQKKVSLKRRPRISRSKVIAKLDAKRAASASISSAAGIAAASRRGRTRSSIGVAAASKPGRKLRGADSDVLMSAKKRVRKSEYMRRQSARASSSAVLEKSSMDVDEM